MLRLRMSGSVPPFLLAYLWLGI